MPQLSGNEPILGLNKRAQKPLIEIQQEKAWNMNVDDVLQTNFKSQKVQDKPQTLLEFY